MIKRTILILSLICLCTCVRGQMNLVRNASLEQRNTCPWTLDQISLARYWNSLDTFYSVDSAAPYGMCAPEYCNACAAPYSVSAPNGEDYYQYPRTGNGMARLMIFFDEGLSYLEGRDYMQAHLYHTLAAGQSYCVTYYANLANQSGYATNNIDAYLDDGTIDTAGYYCGVPFLGVNPQITEAVIIYDTLNWVKIQGSFVANGTERFITIGNFHDKAHTSYVPFTTTSDISNFGYYLIDDVSVIASNAIADAGPDVTVAPGDTAWIGVDTTYGGIYAGDGMPCYWYTLGGTTPIDSGGRIGVRPADTTTYVVAMDLCGTVTYDTVTVNVHCPGLPTASFTDTGTNTMGFMYTGTTAALDSVVWSYGDGSTGTGLSPSHTYANHDSTYHVCVMVYTNCGNDTVCGNVVVHDLFTPNVQLQNVQIFPNPAHNELAITADNKISKVVINNVVGQQVLSQQCNAAKVVVNVADLLPGIYFVRVNDVVVRRFVKE